MITDMVLRMTDDKRVAIPGSHPTLDFLRRIVERASASRKDTGNDESHRSDKVAPPALMYLTSCAGYRIKSPEYHAPKSRG